MGWDGIVCMDGWMHAGMTLSYRATDSAHAPLNITHNPHSINPGVGQGLALPLLRHARLLRPLPRPLHRPRLRHHHLRGLRLHERRRRPRRPAPRGRRRRDDVPGPLLLLRPQPLRLLHVPPLRLLLLQQPEQPPRGRPRGGAGRVRWAWGLCVGGWLFLFYSIQQGCCSCGTPAFVVRIIDPPWTTEAAA